MGPQTNDVQVDVWLGSVVCAQLLGVLSGVFLAFGVPLGDELLDEELLECVVDEELLGGPGEAHLGQESLLGSEFPAVELLVLLEPRLEVAFPGRFLVSLVEEYLASEPAVERSGVKTM